MKTVLILGGTHFIGRVLVEELKDNPSYRITLFNRGKSNTDLFPEVAQIHGDRETDDYRLITNQNWDCVIDCSGYYPLSLEKLLQALKGKVGRYIFISTISVFDLGKKRDKPIDEYEPILDCTEEQKTAAFPAGYGEKKAEMERILLKEEWLDKIILRPSLVYGKYDYTDRFYYWLWRAKFAKEVMLPGDGNEKSSITYVDDLVSLVIAGLELQKHNTIYNAITHDVSMREIMNEASLQFGTKPKLIEVPARKILDAGLKPWRDVALWMEGGLAISSELVRRDFPIHFTSFSESVTETAEYYENLGWPECRYGLKRGQEETLLK